MMAKRTFSTVALSVGAEIAGLELEPPIHQSVRNDLYDV